MSQVDDMDMMIYKAEQKALRLEKENAEKDDLYCQLAEAQPPQCPSWQSDGTCSESVEYDNLRKQLAEAQQWVHDLQSGMFINCVYCGHRYGPKDKVACTMQEVLKRHVEQCPKHPMSVLKAQLEKATSALDGQTASRENFEGAWERAEAQLVRQNNLLVETSGRLGKARAERDDLKAQLEKAREAIRAYLANPDGKLLLQEYADESDVALTADGRELKRLAIGLREAALSEQPEQSQEKAEADDRQSGLHKKFRVERLGGTPHKHDHCEYFVLDWQHDPFTIPAILAYADACETQYPILAADLRKKVKEQPEAPKPQMMERNDLCGETNDSCIPHLSLHACRPSCEAHGCVPVEKLK